MVVIHDPHGGATERRGDEVGPSGCGQRERNGHDERAHAIESMGSGRVSVTATIRFSACCTWSLAPSGSCGKVSGSVSTRTCSLFAYNDTWPEPLRDSAPTGMRGQRVGPRSASAASSRRTPYRIGRDGYRAKRQGSPRPSDAERSACKPATHIRNHSNRPRASALPTFRYRIPLLTQRATKTLCHREEHSDVAIQLIRSGIRSVSRSSSRWIAASARGAGLLAMTGGVPPNAIA
jgi:hypothetical protein